SRPHTVNEDFTRPVPDFARHSLERFATDEDMRIGVTADLHSVVEPRFHGLMQETAGTGKNSFISLFREGMSGARSHALNKLRNSFGDIFSLTSDIVHLPVEERARHPDIQKFAGFELEGDGEDKDKKMVYPKYSPCFYPDGQAGVREHLFLSERLYRAARCIIFGHGATCSPKDAVLRATSMYLDPILNAEARTTFGLVAAVAAFVQSVLTADQTFTNEGEGKQSHINYRHNFDFYLGVMVKASLSDLRGRKRWIEKVLAEWDQNIFSQEMKIQAAKNPKQRRSTTAISDGMRRELDQDMANLDLDSDEESERPSPSQPPSSPSGSSSADEHTVTGSGTATVPASPETVRRPAGNALVRHETLIEDLLETPPPRSAHTLVIPPPPASAPEFNRPAAPLRKAANQKQATPGPSGITARTNIVGNSEVVEDAMCGPRRSSRRTRATGA
ncbi:hypothetical protein CPC08DRAFT_731496, partial [Agrocybe pediades]